MICSKCSKPMIRQPAGRRWWCQGCAREVPLSLQATEVSSCRGLTHATSLCKPGFSWWWLFREISVPYVAKLDSQMVFLTLLGLPTPTRKC